MPAELPWQLSIRRALCRVQVSALFFLGSILGVITAFDMHLPYIDTLLNLFLRKEAGISSTWVTNVRAWVYLDYLNVAESDFFTA